MDIGTVTAERDRLRQALQDLTARYAEDMTALRVQYFALEAECLRLEDALRAAGSPVRIGEPAV